MDVLLLQLRDAFLDRVPDQVGLLVDIKFMHQIPPVDLDGVQVKIEFLGDLLVRGAFADELEDFPLPFRQAVPGDIILAGAYLAQEAVHDIAGDARA